LTRICIGRKLTNFYNRIYRIGRTGRFGKCGIAVNLADSDKAVAYVKAYEEHFGYPIEELKYDDYDKLDAIDQAT
jgi:ATP-dependent RNA helicase DDX19/DBP5